MPAVPALRTWTVGELANAAELNANIRDPINFWRQPPMFLAYWNQAITNPINSIANDTWTLLTWAGGVLVDSEGGYSGSGGRITAVRSGLYDIRAQILYTTNTTGGRALKIERVTPGGTRTIIIESGAISSCSTDFAGIANVESSVRTGDFGYHLDAGDYIEVYTRQTSGGALTYIGHATEQYTWACMRWVALT